MNKLRYDHTWDINMYKPSPYKQFFFFVALGLGFTQTMDVHDISKAVGAFLFLVFGIIGRVELVELATWGEGWNPLPKKQSIWTYESKWCPSISLYNLRYFLVYIHTYIYINTYIYIYMYIYIYQSLSLSLYLYIYISIISIYLLYLYVCLYIYIYIEFATLLDHISCWS